MTRRDATTAPSDESGGPQAERFSGAGRFALSALLSGWCVLAAGCAQDSARPVALGSDIDVGPYLFTVVGARKAPSPPPPISTFRDQPGKTGIVVFIDWKKLDDDIDLMRRLAFIESFFENQLSIVDAEGRRSDVSGAMQARLMYMQDPGPNWQDWVVVFHVPDGSRGLTLLVKNPEPRDGQARVTAVPLGQ